MCITLLYRYDAFCVVDLRYLPVCVQKCSSKSLRTRLSLRFSERVVLRWSSSSDLPQQQRSLETWWHEHVFNVLSDQTWRLRAAWPRWRSAAAEPCPPPEGTPEVARAAGRERHLETLPWETGTRAAAAGRCTLHQSPPLPPMEAHTHLPAYTHRSDTFNRSFFGAGWFWLPLK